MHIGQLLAYSRRIRSWKRFNERIAVGGRSLLRELPRFPGAVLVAGCQRSGTTVLTRVIAGAEGFCTFRITKDDELDAALILAGEEQFRPAARVCFQTTYLNDSFHEYISTPADFKLIWVIRNPFSVVYSMLYHWKTFALDDLYSRCGIGAARAAGRHDDGNLHVSDPCRIEKACFSYIAKSLQLEELSSSLPEDRLQVIDYDQLCRNPGRSLANVFAYIGEPFEERYAQRIHSESISKESLLARSERDLIAKRCLDAYQRSLRFVTAQS